MGCQKCGCLTAAKGAHEGVIIVDKLGCVGEVAKLSELVEECGERFVDLDSACVLSFVKAIPDFTTQVVEELLGEGAQSGRDSGGQRGVEGGDERAQVLAHLQGCVVSFLAGRRVKAGESELAELVEDILGGGFIGDGGTEVIMLHECAEASKAAATG